MNGGRSQFFGSTDSIRDDDNPSQEMSNKINYFITEVDEFFSKSNIPQTDPRRKVWELVTKNYLRELESDLSDSETMIPNNERHEDSQYEFMSIDRTACEKQVIEEWSQQLAVTGGDPVYFGDSKTQDDDELQDSHLLIRESSDVPSGPGADTITEYRRQLVAPEKLMPAVKEDGSRLVTPLPPSTGRSSSTAQKQQCLSIPGPVESIPGPTSRPEDGLTTDRPENHELTTSTSQEELPTGLASETSGRHEFVAAEGKKPPDIRKEEEKTADHGDLEQSHKIEHDCLRTAVAAISQYHNRKHFKGTARTPGSLQPITGKYQWEILNEAYFSVLCVLESAAKITLRLPKAKIIDFQKQDLQSCCKPFLGAFSENDRKLLPTLEQLVGIRNAIAHANTEYLFGFQSSKCGLEGERNDVILYTRTDAHYVEKFRSSTDLFSRICERMRMAFLEWRPVKEYLPQGAPVNVCGHLDEVHEPVESVEEDTSIP